MRTLARLFARGRAVPWLLVLQFAGAVIQALNRGWNGLTPHEQRELRRLAGRARQGPRSLTPSERSELLKILRKAAAAARA